MSETPESMTGIEFTPLRVGVDYDLVNISLLGIDPVTGRSFEQCQEEWRVAIDRVVERSNRLRWWDLPERFRLARQIRIMSDRQGLHGMRLG